MLQAKARIYQILHLFLQLSKFLFRFVENQAKLTESKKGATNRAKNPTTQNNKSNRSSTGETTLNNPATSPGGKPANNSSNKQLNNAAPQQQNSSTTQASVPNKDKVRYNIIICIYILYQCYICIFTFHIILYIIIYYI